SRQGRVLRAAGIAADGLSPDAAVARLTDAARAGNPAALRALREAGAALGVTIAGVVNLLDVDTVVLGGVYAPLAPWLRPPLEAETAGRVITQPQTPVPLWAPSPGGYSTDVRAATT